jgi:hypothetical protein
MYSLLRRPAALLLLAALTLVLTARGIVPALSKVDTDFPNYFTAAKIVADGGNTDRLYDNGWFQDQMRRYRIGKASEGEFKPFPPPTALLLLPFAGLQPLDALRVLTVVSVLCLIYSIILLAKTLSWSLVDSAVFVLLSGYAVLGALRLGQPYILVSLSCILGYYARLRGKPVLAGMCFGLFTPIKYFPVIILVYFAFRKEWKVVFGGAAAILMVTTVSVGILGWKIHEDFLSSVLGNHLIAKLDLQNPFSAGYQSFDSLFRRLFIYDPTLNPLPLYALPRLQAIAVLITKVSILAATIGMLVKLARGAGDGATAPSIGILGVVTLLLAPATATYHFVLLWLPVGLLINYFIRQGARVRACFILGAYALIGFFPYKYTVPFEGRAELTVLAYPRLLLLLAMFAACAHFVWSRAKPANEERSGDSPILSH